MKRPMLLILLVLCSVAGLNATLLINENIQNWANRTSYGSYTQSIPAGTVSMTRCLVASNASASGTGSIGRVQMEATAGILLFPELPSAGTAEFHLAAGAAGRSIKLQQYLGSTWTDITTFTGIGTTGATYSYPVNQLSSTTLRLASPSHAIYVHDIIISDYTGGAITIPTVITTAISAITQTTASSGGTVTSDGGALVTARGVCWSTSSSPTIANSFTSNGSGTGTYVSSLSGLNAQTQYYLRAYATNSQGTAYGEEYSFSTSGLSPPPAPTATNATAIGMNAFTANWTAVTGATGYRLDVSLAGNFSSYVGIYNNYSLSTTSREISGLSSSTTYYYRVRATNTAGSSPNSNTITTVTYADDPYNGYYNPVAGLSGTPLKNGLHDIIDNNTYSNYDGAKTFLFQSLDNNNGVVRCVYTGQDYAISDTYNGGSSPNTEHSFAQSWFDGTPEESIKKADVHHLFITTMSVNSSRGNLPFDVVTNQTTSYLSYNGYVSKRGTNSSGSTVFEPADQHKGNLARAMLYFSVRYNMSLSQEGVDMLDRMIEWHDADPVDNAERTRNSLVLGHQGNRNPFVDHPEYVGSIWGGSSGITLVQFSPASATVNEGSGTVTLYVQLQNPSASSATTAQIALSSGAASDVGNYTTRTITFPAGSSASQSTTITITNDSLLEGDETLVFSLINVSGGYYATTGNYDSFNLEIVDNDIPTPVAISASNIGYTQFTARWNNAAGITSYAFDLSTSPIFATYVSGYESYPIDATSVILGALSTGTVYYYRVRAVYNDTYGAYSNVISTPTLLGSPALSIYPSGTTLTLSWTAVNGASSYRIETSDSPYGPFVALTTTTGFLWNISPLSRKFYRVIAIKQ